MSDSQICCVLFEPFPWKLSISGNGVEGL